MVAVGHEHGHDGGGGPPGGWESILRWSLAQADNSHGVDTSETTTQERGGGGGGGGGAGERVRPLSEEDAAFLRNALAAMQSDDGNGAVMESPVDVTKRLLSTAAASYWSKEQLEEGAEALDVLAEHVEDVDNARDLGALGGIDMLVTMFRNEREGDDGSDDQQRGSELRRYAMRVLSCSCQNHEEMQKLLVEKGVVDVIVNYLRAPGCDAAQAGYAAAEGYAFMTHARLCLVLLSSLSLSVCTFVYQSYSVSSLMCVCSELSLCASLSQDWRELVSDSEQRRGAAQVHECGRS